MPKPKFPFSRRKSSANALEELQATSVAESTFKVFERSDGGSTSFDGGIKLWQATTNHLPAPTAPRPRTSHKDGNMFEGIVNANRSAHYNGESRSTMLTAQSGSGASNSNTTSTTDNSSRLSAASTAPSSTTSRNEELRSHNEKPQKDPPPSRKGQSTFSLKNAGRSLSWGLKKQNDPISPSETPSPPRKDDYQPRQRAVTASSYASTATPPKLNERDLGLSLGGDFADMFSGFGKGKSELMEESNRAMSRSPDLPPKPAVRTDSSNRLSIPTPINIDKDRDIESAPYSWSTQHSQDGLMSNSSPPPFALRNDENAPPVPQHSTPAWKLVNRQPATSRRPPLTESGVKRNSLYSSRRQSTHEVDDDEGANLLRDSIAASRKLNATSFSPEVRKSWIMPPAATYKVDDNAIASWAAPSAETTPRQQMASLSRNDSMFDAHVVESANLAQRLANTAMCPPKQAQTSKVMTPAQFERYKQDQERNRVVRDLSKDGDEDEDDDTYEEEEDEVEKSRELAKQRRKQEAHMAVYRQQMMKVTGETGSTVGYPILSGKTSSIGNRPSMYATQSSPNLASAEEGEEEDDEVPLAILQAHGFPNKNRPPLRPSGSNPNMRAQTTAGPLPAFARHLPQDPYFGAGVVQPTYRESMQFGGGAGSVHTVPLNAGPPGGLVGVIATEERSRAMRRGSPNAQGTYGQAPTNGFNDMGMPPNMMNGMGQMSQMGQMQPNQVAAQMQQMQEFMKVQMQFMQMMSQGGGPQNGQLPPPPQIDMKNFQRPNSSHGIPSASQIPSPGSSHQRAMSMLDPNATSWMQQGMPPGGMYAPTINGQAGAYTPSIAPSERSNVGLPGRYRPVSHMPAPDNKSRASTMTGLNNWDTKTLQPIVKTVLRQPVDDEDDEEGWEEMNKKRQQRKSLWKSKKESSNNGLKDLLGYTK
ncbi:hypothetical protein BJ878DRAFT_36294 [Calycina marina]|uniref:Uncharacterized protein n=1 Tax=Calycina marina TaxID=1763456 RepID=A0A9P8CKC6_9HELO|nr:hypothetical protein BJ878DRAFT_36294 [Calycina marina]